MEGNVKVTRGRVTILEGNLWIMLMALIHSGELRIPATRLKLFVDGEEIRKPKTMDDES